MIRVFTSETTINVNKNYVFEISNNLKSVLILLIGLVFLYFVIKTIFNSCVKIIEIRNFKKRTKNKGKETSSVSETNEDD